MYCENCGKQLPDGVRFCTGCGAALPGADSNLKHGTHNSRSKLSGPPKNFFQLLAYILRRLPAQFLKALPVTLIVGAISWLLHTYLLVYTNGGFNPDTWLGQNLLNVKGTEITSTLLWSMIGAVLSGAVFFFVHRQNPFKAAYETLKIPYRIVKKSKDSPHRFLPMILIACAAALLFDKLLSGVAGLVAGSLLMGSVAAFITGRGSIFVTVFRMIYTDIQTYILRKKKFRMDADSIYLIVGSSGIVLILYGLFKALNVFPAVFNKLTLWIPFLGNVFNVMLIVVSFAFNSVWFILLVLGIVFMIKNRRIHKTVLFIAVFFFAVLAANRALGIPLLADDGGWIEAGGTLGGWLASAGMVPAVLRGLPPAIGAMAGTLLPSIFNGLFNDFPSLKEADVASVPQEARPLVDIHKIVEGPVGSDVAGAGQNPSQDEIASMYAKVDAKLGSASAEGKFESSFFNEKGQLEYNKEKGVYEKSETYTIFRAEAEYGIEASGPSVDAKAGIGSDLAGVDVGVSAAVGKVAAKGGVKLEIDSKGLDAVAGGEIGVAAIEGKASAVFHLGWFDINTEASLKAGAIGVEGKIGVVDNKFTIKGGASAVVGGSAGISIGLSEQGVAATANFFNGVKDFFTGSS